MFNSFQWIGDKRIHSTFSWTRLLWLHTPNSNSVVDHPIEEVFSGKLIQPGATFSENLWENGARLASLDKRGGAGRNCLCTRFAFDLFSILEDSAAPHLCARAQTESRLYEVIGLLRLFLLAPLLLLVTEDQAHLRQHLVGVYFSWRCLFPRRANPDYAALFTPDWGATWLRRKERSLNLHSGEVKQYLSSVSFCTRGTSVLVWNRFDTIYWMALRRK